MAINSHKSRLVSYLNHIHIPNYSYTKIINHGKEVIRLLLKKGLCIHPTNHNGQGKIE